MFSRSRMYVNIAQFLMIGYLFFRDNSIPLWLLVPLLGSLALLTIIDWKLIFSPELGTSSSKNPISMETLENTRKILKAMEAKA